jgi:autonomous glycyl radical cofactor GrcA
MYCPLVHQRDDRLVHVEADGEVEVHKELAVDDHDEEDEEEVGEGGQHLGVEAVERRTEMTMRSAHRGSR